MAKKTTDQPSKQQPYFERFRQVVDGKRKAAIFTHSGPDPDGIGSMMALEWLFSKLGLETDCFYTGSVSHPQNIAMVNLLDPNLRPIGEYVAEQYDLHVLVDAVPSNAGIGELEVKFDIVIDHHKENPNGSSGLYINFKAGSSCGTIYDLMVPLTSNPVFEDDNDQDARVATAILIGISTDTDSLMSDDVTQYEFTAWSQLFEYRDAAALKRIVNFERPKLWIETEAQAVDRASVLEGVGVVGLGNIPGKHRDMIADMAAQMVTWEDVHTAIAFAIVEGDRLEGSVRSTNASVPVPGLCKHLGGKHGQGGGKLGKGAYRYALAGGGIDEEDDDDTADKIWGVINEKETKRIYRIIAK